jgi:hypothetical protein
LELLIEKLCLLISLVLLFLFLYPALFRIGNYANDNQQLTINDLKQRKISLYSNLWKHSFALSSTLHLIMSFLIIISTVLIHARQMNVGLKDSGNFLSLLVALFKASRDRRTDAVFSVFTLEKIPTRLNHDVIDQYQLSII